MAAQRQELADLRAEFEEVMVDINSCLEIDVPRVNEVKSEKKVDDIRKLRCKYVTLVYKIASIDNNFDMEEVKPVISKLDEKMEAIKDVFWPPDNSAEIREENWHNNPVDYGPYDFEDSDQVENVEEVGRLSVERFVFFESDINAEEQVAKMFKEVEKDGMLMENAEEEDTSLAEEIPEPRLLSTPER